MWNEIIKQRRLELGLTQDDLANRLKLDQRRVSRWECGKHNPSPYYKSAIAKALRCKQEDIWEGEAK